MTKLEEKLIELGYERCSYYKYEKKFETYCEMFCEVDIKEKPKGRLRLGIYDWIYTQQDIDNLQQAFNEMQKDLEVLKKHEGL